MPRPCIKRAPGTAPGITTFLDGDSVAAQVCVRPVPASVSDLTRIRRSAIRASGSCSNRSIIYLRDIERLVLSGMAKELKDPRLIETYVRNYNSERGRLAGDAVDRGRALAQFPCATSHLYHRFLYM